MNKQTKNLLLATALIAIGVTSCKKKEEAADPSVLIVGTWNLSKQAIDSNYNGQADAGEWKTASDLQYSLAQSTYGTYGTGEDHVIIPGVSDNTTHFSYMVQTNKQYIDVTYGFNTFHLHIDRIDAHNITLKDTTGGIAMWQVFTK